MKIQVFGTGCAPCKTVLRNVEAAVAELGLGAQVEHATRVQAMLDAGITGTPALVVDGEVKCVGRVLDVAASKVLLTSSRTELAK
jgi:small redox-active disulfide protein 2